MDSTRRNRIVDLERKDWNPANSYGNEQICLPMTLQVHQQFSTDNTLAKSTIRRAIKETPELFPQAIREKGFWLDGHERRSTRLPEVQLRRIRVPKTNTVFTIRPSAVLPSMVGFTDDVSDGLKLLSHGNSPELVAEVAGRNPMFWSRLISRIGRFSLPGTTLRNVETLPEHLAADEYHSTINRNKVYTCVTSAWGVLLGLAVSRTSDEAGLQDAYGQFRTEMQNINPDYTPRSVNTDGWPATRAAWRTLFTSVALILCFLHGFLKIRDRCRKKFQELKTRIWDVYRASTRAEFQAQMSRLKTWAAEQELPSTVRTYVDKFTALSDRYAEAYDHPGCHRTSNMVDRLMDQLDRLVHRGRRLHGHLMSAEYRLRGWALLLNFRPFSARHQSRRSVTWPSAAARVNENTYHDNWLHNLYVSASLGGCRI